MLTPVKLFFQLHYVEVGPKKLELSYFSHSYAIFSLQLCYFFIFPRSYATPKEKNSVTGGEKC